MKYHSNSFMRTFITKLMWWYILLFIISLVFYFNFNNNIDIQEFNIDYIKGILTSFNNIHSLKNINIYILLYQFVLTIYTCISYFKYEENNSPEFIYTRIDKKYNYNHKMRVLIIMIIVFRTLYFLINYYLYFKYFNITIIDYLLCVIYHIIIIFIIYFYKIITTK